MQQNPIIYTANVLVKFFACFSQHGSGVNSPKAIFDIQFSEVILGEKRIYQQRHGTFLVRYLPWDMARRHRVEPEEFGLSILGTENSRPSN